MSDNPIVIVVCGQPGAGKSAFIESVAPQAEKFEVEVPMGVASKIVLKLGDFFRRKAGVGELDGSGRKIVVKKADFSGTPVVFIDMPSHMSINNLKNFDIQTWLENRKDKKRQIDWVIYMHNIDRNRASEIKDDVQHLNAIDMAFVSKKTTFVTAFWDRVKNGKTIEPEDVDKQNEQRKKRHKELEEILEARIKGKADLVQFSGQQQGAGQGRYGREIMASILERARKN